MYFFNTQGVLRDLKSGELNEKESIKYLLGMLILENLGAIWSGSDSNKSSVPLKIAGSIFSVILTIWGIGRCYRVNLGYDNKDFIKRYVCIAFPVNNFFGVITVVLIFFLILALMGMRMFKIDMGIPDAGLSVAVYAVVLIISISSYIVKSDAFTRLHTDKQLQ